MARGTSDLPTLLTGREGMLREAFVAKWGRRLLTIPGLLVATGVYGLLLPVLLSYALIADRLRGRPSWLLARFHLYIFSILLVHWLALALLQGTWLWTLFMSPQRKRQVNRRIEIFFIPKTIALAELIYGVEFELDNIECCAPGPILLLSRHASILDTILPIKLLGEAHGMSLRIVQKDQLRWNPVVDIASHRLPRAFIKRGSGNIERQIRHMKHLQEGISDSEALLVFPEGSRFTPEKKARVLAKIGQSNPIAAERASRLQTVLPVRPAGTGALMDERPDMDVVFLAHTGLEGANRLEDFVGGALYKRKVKVKFWRVPASEIPRENAERLAWLHEQWARLDRWVQENQD